MSDTIHARISSNTPEESRAQFGAGIRCIPWIELDQRAHELVGLVDAAVAEVTAAVKNAPPCSRPSRSGTQTELVGYEKLVEDVADAITQMALAVLNKPSTKDLSRGLTSEATMVAAIKLAALATYTGNMGISDAKEELEFEMRRLLSKTGADVEELGPRSLN